MVSKIFRKSVLYFLVFLPSIVSSGESISKSILTFLPNRYGHVSTEWEELGRKEFPNFYKKAPDALKENEIAKGFLNASKNIGLIVTFELPVKIDHGIPFCKSNVEGIFYLNNEEKNDDEREAILTGDSLALISFDSSSLSRNCKLLSERELDNYIMISHGIIDEFVGEIWGHNQQYLFNCNHLRESKDNFDASLISISEAPYEAKVDYVLFYESSIGNLRVKLKWDRDKFLPNDCSVVFD